MKLKPKRFKYKEKFVPIGDDPDEVHSGLIAQEVLEIRPDLVAFNSEGEVYTVKYTNLITELLNEVQISREMINNQSSLLKIASNKIELLEQKINDYIHL